jgi:hypothetical protein
MLLGISEKAHHSNEFLLRRPVRRAVSSSSTTAASRARSKASNSFSVRRTLRSVVEDADLLYGRPTTTQPAYW